MPGQQTFFQSLRCAIRGSGEIVRSQRNARIQIGFGLLAAVVAAALGFDVIRWALLVLIMGLVFVAESLNTAIEAVVDLASPELHPLARKAKDTAAGAVLIASATSVIGGCLLFGDRLLQLLGEF